MQRLALSLFALSLAIAPLATAYAAPAAPVGLLSCTGSRPLSANLSYFDIATTEVVTQSSTGAPRAAAPVTTIVVHVALSQFNTFYDSASQGLLFNNCTITSNAGGSAITLTFKGVFLTSVTAIASEGNSTATGGTGHANGEAYISANLSFDGIEVQSNGANDGGVTVTKTSQPNE